MKSSRIRQQFLDFFAEKGHTIVSSSGLVPHNDPTLMFTNSGMVQFKDVFLGTDKRSYTRATSVQACLRAGGKHNDLDNVGYTARHHTFFEMLGNWSFGDYFKRDALLWSWELLTQVYKLPADKLWATVYIDDDESYNIWTKEIGLPQNRVIRIGDNKGAKYQSDNFWMMADTGPCGPCSEIFYDHGDNIAGGPPGSPDADGDRYIEIWNNVFMQFDMQSDGSVKPLPAPCVDTGMGLERLAAILQNVHSNYEIDIFQALIKAAARETQSTDLNHPSLRVIADHIRACAFLITDGVTPSNIGRGYVLRRIARRAIRHGYKLGQTSPFFYKLIPDLVKEMGEAYPEFAEKTHNITHILELEETNFFETIANGMGILNTALQALTPNESLSGKLAFKLHDTFGFPRDLTADVCRESNVTLNEAEFDAAMEAQKAKGRAAGKFKMDALLEYNDAHNLFIGYDHLEAPQSRILALYREGVSVNVLNTGESGIIVLDITPFYAESGGQIGDTGVLTASNTHVFIVNDTQKIKADVFGHHGTVSEGCLNLGDTVYAKVNSVERLAIIRHHSATHLLHKALRFILGDHVQQKGSLVSSTITRFDFAHTAPVTLEQLQMIERWVNQAIMNNTPTSATVMTMDDAKTTGAMMLFGEKYGDTVRVLNIGESVELCGGVHVERTGDIGLFKIISESGVAAGIRRIEAVAGLQALNAIQHADTTLNGVASVLHTHADGVLNKLTLLQAQLKDADKLLIQTKQQLATYQSSALMSKVKTIKGIQVLSAQMADNADSNTLKTTIDQLKDRLKSGVIVLASIHPEQRKVQLIAGVTSDLIGQYKAGIIINQVAQMVGGKGGGKPDIAMAGGTDISALPNALEAVADLF